MCIGKFEAEGSVHIEESSSIPQQQEEQEE